LIEESPRWYEVASFHDDRRQDHREKQMCVELDDFILVATEVCYHAENYADHDQKTAFRTEIFQTSTRMETCTTSIEETAFFASTGLPLNHAKHISLVFT